MTWATWLTSSARYNRKDETRRNQASRFVSGNSGNLTLIFLHVLVHACNHSDMVNIPTTPEKHIKLSSATFRIEEYQQLVIEKD